MEGIATKPTLQKYPAYKDSGEYWMGEIPDHWEIKKLKHVFQEKRKVTNPNLNCGSISFGKVVYKADEKVTEATKASYQEVLAGEYLVNPLNLNYDLISLRIGLSDINVVVSSGYIVLKNAIELNKSYFNYLLHRYDVAYMKLLGSGVRQTISFNHIANSLLAYPPIEEQTAIAAFLDDKTSKIDLAIAQKEKMIALLKERKQIIIQNAVTKGLNPNAKMKDSGVEWIGEIPEGWEVSKAKFYSKIFVPERTKPELDEDFHSGIPWITTDLLGNDYLDIQKAKYFVNSKNARIAGSRIVKKDSILATCVGNFGIASINSFDCIINQQIQGYTQIKLNPVYFIQIVRLSKDFFSNNSTMTTIQYVSKDTFGDLPILIPTIQEQTAIVAHIETQSDKIDKAIGLQEQQIEKLKELKATLIDGAVTGKIKVR